MFFTHELLARPGGKFCLLWRAAVKKEKLKQNQLDGLDVQEVCNDLIKYIRPRGDSRMGRITGFSLRLSSQLVHGVIVCYNWKVAFLLKDASSCCSTVYAKQVLLRELTLPQPKKKRSRTSGETVEENFQLKIDLHADPMFGVAMELTPMLPPYTSTDETSSSSGSEQMRKRPRVDKHAIPDVSLITMQEGVPMGLEQMTDVLVQGEAMPFDLNDLNAFGEISLFDVATTTKEPMTSLPEVTTPAGAVLPSTPTKPKSPKRKHQEKPAEESTLAFPLPEDAAMAIERERSVQEQPPDEIAQKEPSPLVLDSLDEAEIVAAQASRRRRKPAFELKMEIKSDDMKKQLKVKPKTLQNYIEEGSLDEPLNFIPLKELLQCPMYIGRSFDKSRVYLMRDDDSFVESTTRRLLHTSLIEITKDLESSGLSRLHDDTSAGISGEPVADESSVQVARDISAMSGLAQPNIAEDPSLLQDSTSGKTLGNQLKEPRVSTVPARDISDLAPPMELDELAFDMPREDIPPEPSRVDDLVGLEQELSSSSGSDQGREARVLRQVTGLSSEGNAVTFSQIAPPRFTSRPRAAKKFYALLACAKSQSVNVTQQHPYGEIEISLP